MSLIKEEYYIVKAKDCNGKGQLAGYRNKLYKNKNNAVSRAEMVAKASGKEMLVFQAICCVKPVLVTTTETEKL